MNGSLTRVARARDDFHRRRAWRRVARNVLLPPPASAFAAFGSSFIVPPARIENPQFVHVGDGVLIHEEVWLSVVPSRPGVTPRLTFGDRVRVGRFCQFSCVGRISVGPDVLISDEVHVGDTYHEYRDPAAPVIAQGMAASQPIMIGAGALIGMGAIVLPGVTIGANAYVSEGSVVTNDVPARAVVAGNPARVVGTPHR